MYLSHWGLSQSPFGSSDPRFFFQSPGQEEALARMQFLVDSQRRVGLLLGRSGYGKTALVDFFARQLARDGVDRACVNLDGIDVREFLWSINAQLGTNPRAGAPTFALWRGLTDHIVAAAHQRQTTVILLDDADDACDDVLGQVVRLAHVDTGAIAGLTFILTAQPQRLGRIGTRLLEEAELRVDLEAWNKDDTQQYLETVLSRAGRQTKTFESQAIARLHELTEGVPRRVKQLADLTLLAGAGRQVARIDADTVESALDELGLVTTG